MATDVIVFSDGFTFPLKDWEDRAAAMLHAGINAISPTRKWQDARFIVSAMTRDAAMAQAQECFSPDGSMFRGVPVEVV